MANRAIDPSKLPSNNLDTPNLPPPKIVSGRTKNRGRSLSSEVRTIVNELFSSVIIPSTKSMIFEFLVDGLRQMILGKTGGVGRRGLPGEYTSYNRMYTARGRPARRFERARPYSMNPNNTPDTDVFFDNEIDARMVLAAMIERIAQFGHVTLGDFRHFSGVDSNITHQRYGWTDLRGSTIEYTSDEGWIIILPDVQIIN